MQVPFLESSAATCSQTSALRDEMYTVAPASTKPSAIIRPMPRLPPVTSAVLPAMENRSEAVIATLWPISGAAAQPGTRADLVTKSLALAGLKKVAEPCPLLACPLLLLVGAATPRRTATGSQSQGPSTRTIRA